MMMSLFMTVVARRKIVVLGRAEEMLPAVTVKGGTDVGGMVVSLFNEARSENLSPRMRMRRARSMSYIMTVAFVDVGGAQLCVLKQIGEVCFIMLSYFCA